MAREIDLVTDNLGRVTEVYQDLDSSNQQLRAKYAYNTFSETTAITRLKDSVEKSFQFAYDKLGRVKTMTDSLQQVTDNYWWTSCESHTTTTPRGLRRKYGMDLLCRPTLLEVGEPSSSDDRSLSTVEESHEFHYDELGRLVKSVKNGPERYNQAVLGFDSYSPEERSYLYDELDRLIEITYEDGSTASWEYDAEGNVTKYTDPEGKVTRYEYYRDYLLHKVIIERGNPATVVGEFVYSYDAAGRLDQITYPASTGITAVFRDPSDTPGSGFDPNGNLRYLRYMKTGETDPIRSFDWTYDDSDNRQSMLDVTPGKAVQWEYGYDWLDRLVTVKRAEEETVGELPSSPLSSAFLQREYVFDESDNRVFFDDHVNGATYHYLYKSIDDNGTTRYSDQLEEILISTTVGDRNLANFVPFETFEHDEDGNMTKRTSASTGEEVSYEWTEFESRGRYEV